MNHDGARFCSACGSPIKTVTTPGVQQGTKAVPGTSSQSKTDTEVQVPQRDGIKSTYWQHKGKPALIKISVLAIASLIAALLCDMLAPSATMRGLPFLTQLGGLVGTAFVPFSAGTTVAVFVRGKAGIAVGLVIITIVSLLMLLGRHTDREMKRLGTSLANHSEHALNRPMPRQACGLTPQA
jgi:hypothetical protein